MARNILALGAMFGGMPVYPRSLEPTERYPEAKLLAIDLGVTYHEAERAFLRLGVERARDLLAHCRSHNVDVSHELLDLFVRNDPPPPSIRELSEAFQKAKADPASLLRPGVPEARQQRRSLVDRKARRAKRKQRGKR